MRRPEYKGTKVKCAGCWDAHTFEFYNNVMMGRNSANWSAVDPQGLCPGCTNYFPALSPSFPTGSCVYDGTNPMNCPLMALPWANNFGISNLATMSITSSTRGLNITNLNNAMTQTEFVCPSGANCGTHGPYPD